MDCIYSTCTTCVHVYVCVWVPCMEEWRPALSLTTSHVEHTSIGSLFLCQKSKCTKEHGGNNGVSPHGCRIKMRDSLWCVPFQTRRCAGKQLKVCVRACARSYPLTFPVLSEAALDHWNVLRHQKTQHIKTETVYKVAGNALWGFNDFCDFFIYLFFFKVCGPEEERQGDGRSAPLSPSRR